MVEYRWLKNHKIQPEVIMSKNRRNKSNAVYNYDGMAKRALDTMKDENLIIFINRIFDRDLSVKSKVTRLATETYDEKIKQNRCDYYVCVRLFFLGGFLFF